MRKPITTFAAVLAFVIFAGMALAASGDNPEKGNKNNSGSNGGQNNQSNQNQSQGQNQNQKQGDHNPNTNANSNSGANSNSDHKNTTNSVLKTPAKGNAGNINLGGVNVGSVNKGDHKIKLGDGNFDKNGIGALDESKHAGDKGVGWRYQQVGGEWWFWAPSGHWCYY